MLFSSHKFSAHQPLMWWITLLSQTIWWAFLFLQIISSDWLLTLEFKEYIFTVFGIISMGAGLFFFWKTLLLGWILLFVGNFSIVLQILREFLIEYNNPNFPLWSRLGALTVSFYCVALLLHPQIRTIFAWRKLQVWIRAKRYRVFILGEANFLNFCIQGAIVDVSLTGCSIVATKKISIGERVVFKNEQNFQLELQIIREIEIDKLSVQSFTEKVAGPYFYYGAQHNKSMSLEYFTRYLIL